MTPVVLDMVMPAGSVGDTDHDTTVPPVEVGVVVVIAVPLVKVNELGE